MSWSRNCPHWVSMWVATVALTFAEVWKLVLTKRALGRTSETLEHDPLLPVPFSPLPPLSLPPMKEKEIQNL